MCVQWPSMGMLMLKKPFTEFLVIYCLIKAWKPLQINVGLN
jgi:hypothetical protein